MSQGPETRLHLSDGIEPLFNLFGRTDDRRPGVRGRLALTPPCWAEGIA